MGGKPVDKRSNQRCGEEQGCLLNGVAATQHVRPRGYNPGAAAFGAVASEDVGPQPTIKPRVLERTHSDPNVVTKELLHNMQTATEAGAFFSRDPSDNKTVKLGGTLGVGRRETRRPLWRPRCVWQRRRGEAEGSYAARRSFAS